MCQLFLFVGSTAVLEAPLAQPACPTVFDPVGSMLVRQLIRRANRCRRECENGRESRNKESRAHGFVA